ncbi:MAG: hypothetical protein KDD33_11150 [Bdellovibrionales bacterium]|nr:hypothetical protein [Bdellovibrionales bacterium]
MKKLFVLFTIFSLILTCQSAQAGFLFAPATTYLTQSLENPNSAKQDVKFTILDVRLGYTFDFGLFLGGIYSLLDNDLLSDSSDFHFGPTVGYQWKNIFTTFTYYLYGEKDQTIGNVKYANIQGFQFDIAYVLPITEKVFLGPQLTYHNIKYKEAQTNGVAAAAELKWRGLSPQFTLLFTY